MGWIAPTPPPYDPLVWRDTPFPERARMVCTAWAMQGYGTPRGVFVVYAAKIALYVGVWMALSGLGPSSSLADFLAPLAFQRAIVWSLLFEVLGLGCGSGPLTGRYFPPVGGFLYFLRPGATKLPLFPGAPLIGARTRGLLDVLLYLALVIAASRALLAPSIGASELWPLVVLVPVLGVLDKTIFLAARAEHFWVTLVCFALTDHWIPAAMAVQLALWLWAGVSKLNPHFPTVTCVMTSNSPITFGWQRRLMYVDYPRDLRPSKLATALAHFGTLLELGVPLAFVLTPLGTPPVVAVVLMLLLHVYITSNVPMGVPLEWNVIVVYGGLALFWAHPDVSVLSIDSPLLAAFLVLVLLVLPLAGNVWPARISFLLAMRYYAGNWAYSVWLFRGDSHRKLAKLTTSSGWVYDQLARFYDRATAVGLVGKVMAFRLMHLHGRALPLLLPKALGGEPLERYEWIDGEIAAGMVLGWNFGDGHLHHEQLLAAVQAQCGFEEGELRCIFVESQPLFGHSLAYRVVDAKTGLIERGELPVAELGSRQPWQATDAAPAT
ncbi:MAG: DUF3556 domain-containing protein [Sandaracinus sp.]